jgi:YbgC/YbaW family acyl-CoA thioester hydrolase
MAVVLRRRVDWPMLDVASVVFYPQYFDLAHRFFEEAWEPICGIDYPTLTGKMRLGFPAVRTESDHVAPLRYGDEIVCKLWIEKVGTKSCTWRYQFENQNGLLCWNGKVVTVCVDLDNFESKPIPAELAENLRSCGED